MTSAFTLKCLQVHTGVKFMLVSSGPEKIREQDDILNKIFEAYADFCGKNPF